MDIAPVDNEFCSCRIESLIFQFSQFPAVYGIGKVRAEKCHIKMVGAFSDLFIGRKADPDFAVGKFGVGEQMLRHSHNFRNTGLIVSS